MDGAGYDPTIGETPDTDMIYIQGLPLDVSESEIATHFGSIGVVKFDKKQVHSHHAANTSTTPHLHIISFSLPPSPLPPPLSHPSPLVSNVTRSRSLASTFPCVKQLDEFRDPQISHLSVSSRFGRTSTKCGCTATRAQGSSRVIAL